MIENHFGKPGSGKSYSVMADVVIPALKDGRRVLTNIDGAFDKMCRVRLAAALGFTPEELDERYLALTEDEIIGGSCWGLVQARDIYVIDEVQRYWPGGSLKPTDPTAFKFFGEHRHFGCDIHCITINPTNFQSPMRSYAEVCHSYKKLGVFGMNSRFVRRDFAGAVPDDEAEVANSYGKYKKEIFGFYKSVTADGNNVVGKQKNVLKSPKVIIALLFLVVVIPLCLWRIHKTQFIPKRDPNNILGKRSSEQYQESAPRRAFTYPGSDEKQPTSSYTAYSCITDGVCYVRLADGSVELVPDVRLPGGFVYFGGRALLQGGSR